MAMMMVQRKSENGASFQNAGLDDFPPQSHVLFANALVCFMCDEFNLYWEPEVSQGYSNFFGLAQHARISTHVLQAIRMTFLAHNKFQKTAEEVASRGSDFGDLPGFIDGKFQRLLLLGGWKSLRKVIYVLACVVGVCIELYRRGCDFAPSMVAVKVGKLMHQLDKEWKGELYLRLHDFACCLVERGHRTRFSSGGSCDSNENY